MDPPVSLRFCAVDSDVTCRSSNGVIFKVHRKNLEMNSNISDRQDKASGSESALEVVLMTESSVVLDLLFQFMYNQPQPDLTNLSFNSLAALTEAVEKYQVYSAQEICKACMRGTIPNHALQVLNFAVNYKYTNLMDEAAEHTVGFPLKDLLATLKPQVFPIWVQYHKAWMDVLSQVYTYKEPILRHWEGTKDTVGAKPMVSPCEVWTEIWAMVAYRLAGKPESLLDVDNIFRQSKELLGLRCTACERWIADWHDDTMYRLGKVPKFSTFL